MRSIYKKYFLLFTAIWSALVMGLASGCASGGFQLTRKYAGFVNRQHIIIRIILYVFATVVFFVTLLIDMVIFNTIDFWTGKVSQGTYEFKQEGRIYLAHHQFLPSGLRQSRIEISGRGLDKTQVILLKETPTSEIEVFENGVLKAKVSDISEVPILSLYDVKGLKTQSLAIPLDRQVAIN